MARMQISDLKPTRFKERVVRVLASEAVSRYREVRGLVMEENGARNGGILGSGDK